MIKGENKLEAEASSIVESKATQRCMHFFGYLAVEHPRNQPIPDECLHCNLALECINKKTEEDTAKVVKA